jgi:hypothetical protein
MSLLFLFAGATGGPVVTFPTVRYRTVLGTTPVRAVLATTPVRSMRFEG